jgi:hypothetical protein
MNTDNITCHGMKPFKEAVKEMNKTKNSKDEFEDLLRNHILLLKNKP